MAMALDEQKDTDDVFVVNNFQYIVDKDFMKKASPIKIDFLVTGFKVDSSIELNSVCSSCSTSKSCN